MHQFVEKRKVVIGLEVPRVRTNGVREGEDGLRGTSSLDKSICKEERGVTAVPEDPKPKNGPDSAGRHTCRDRWPANRRPGDVGSKRRRSWR